MYNPIKFVTKLVEVVDNYRELTPLYRSLGNVETCG